MKIPWNYDNLLTEEFKVGSDDFGSLEIRSSGTTGLWYFFDTKRRSLIKHFRIYEGPQVVTLMTVTLIRKEEKLQPRIRLWKRKSSKSKTVSTELAEAPLFVEVRASVDTDRGHEKFWAVVEFLRSMREIDVPREPFRLAGDAVEEVAALLRTQNKRSVLTAVQAAIGAQLTESDLTMLAGRKKQLEFFEELLDPDSSLFQRQLQRIGAPEKVWQRFFESNQWIFGYGLSLVSCEAFDDHGLERITTGSNVFTGGGKRIDALMRTRGYVRSLVFAEIKKHTEALLTSTPYRKPDVFKASSELVGAVAQVQKTTDKALRGLEAQIHRHYRDDGEFTGVEFATIRPRQVVIIGTLAQLSSNGTLNRERVHSFELYRRSISDVEILTYDELYERARFIVGA